MSGNKKRRRAIDKGQAEQNRLTREAMAIQQPYVDAGMPATNALGYLSGFGTEDQQAGAQSAFEGSLFNQIAMGDYERDRGQIADSLGAQGLAYSSAFLNADANAYANNRSNAFANYLNNTTNLAGIGVSATGAQTNLLSNQGNSAANAGYAKANAHRSTLDTIGQVSSIGSNVATAMSGF